MQSDLIALTSAPHPFQAATMTLPVAAGPTLAEMLEQVQADPILAMHAVAFVDGHRIERQYWRGFRPKPGTLVEIRVLPMGGGGGGKDTLRTVLQLAVLVAAATIPGLQVLGLSAAQQAFLQAGIAVVGNLAINALVPVQQPDGPPEEEKRLGIQGFQNRARPFDPVTQVLGRHRIAPDYGARVFTEIIGKDQYLRAIFVWGIGPLHIDVGSIRIGETPIANFEGVEMEHRQGFPSDPPRKLYSNKVFEAGNIQINLENAGAQIRTAPAIADELSVDITFPGGLSSVGRNTGNFLSAFVGVSITYREVGDTTWLTPNFTAKTFPDSWITGDQIRFIGRRKGAIRHGMRWDVASTGSYEVKVEWLFHGEPTGKNEKVTDVFWTALRAIEDTDPISSPVPVATTSVRIKATDQLNGVLDELNGIVTTIGKDWDGTAWVDDQPITRPASLFRHVLQGRANAIPLEDSRINLPALEDFHDFNVAKDQTCATVVTSGRSVWEVLSEVAACGRASPAEIDGKWGVVIDRPQSVPVSHITPRNSANFKSEKAFIELPHAFRIPFVNEEQNWRRDERRAYFPGYNASNATKFEELTLPGITNPDQVERFGRYRAAQGIHQPERFSFRQDMEFLTYQRGDRVKITHDVLLVGLHSGRIKEVVLDGSDNVTGLVLDEEVEMETGTEYGISIRTLDDPGLTRRVQTVAGEHTTITLSTSIPPVGGLPAVERHNIFGFGLFGLETDDAQIISIRPATNAEADVVAVPYREVIYSGDDEPIPPFETRLTPLPVLPAPLVRNVISDERVLSIGASGGLRVRVAFDVDSVPDRSAFVGATLEVQQRSTGTGEPYTNATIEERTGGRVVIGDVRENDRLDFRLRWVPQGGRLPGPWSSVPSHRIVGRTTPPETLQGLTLSAFGGAAYLRWSRPGEIDVRFGGQVQFRHSPSMTGATWGASNSIGELAQASSQFAVLPLKKGTYLARVIDQSGRLSTDTATITTKQATVLAFASSSTIDEASGGFSGTKSDLTVNSGTLELTDPNVSQTGLYEFGAGLDLGAVVKRRLTSVISLSSFNAFDLIDERTDLIDDWSSFDGDVPDGGDVIVQVRHTDDDPAASTQLATNGTFDTDLSGWSSGANWSWSNGKAALSASGISGSVLQQDFGLRSGEKSYSFSVEVSTGTGLKVLASDALAQNSDIILHSTAGTGTFSGAIPDGYDFISFLNLSGAQLDCTLDNISIEVSTTEWTAWDRLDSAEFEARGFEFRALVSTIGPDVNVAVSELGINADSL